MSLIGMLTLAVGLLGSALVFWLRPAAAAALFIVVLFLWPDGVRIKPYGGFEADPVKFMGPFLLLNLIFKERCLRDFRMHVMDVAVLALVVCGFIAAFANIPTSELIEHQANSISRSILIYVIFRLAIRTREDLYKLLRAAVYAGGILAGLCMYESVTGFSIYDWFVKTVGGYEWRTPWPPRLGLNRAVGSFNNPLPMGLLFAFLAPATLILQKDPHWGLGKTLFFLPLICGGVLSTMSSGPIFATAAIAAAIVFFPFRRLAPVAAAAALTMLLFWISLGPQLGLGSVGEAVAVGTYDAKNASYREGLVREAFTGGMDGHWMFGYGRVGLGTTEPDSPEFNWKHQDLVNMWILSLVFYGLFGLIPLIAVHLLVYWRLGLCLFAYPPPRTDFTVWLLLAAYTGWQVAYLAVAPLSSLFTFHWAMLGVLSNMPEIVRRWDESATNPVQVPQQVQWKARTAATAAPA